ncbi:TPA: DUF1292 domain-containing protein [Candidatus Ventrenecus stercoripullorum]|nr:DUF1292 domain-containing protein [Candidatus Ventrenecus stercoripullorum]
MKEKESVTNDVFVLEGEDGVEKEYQKLFAFESSETNKNYIVYTDNTKDDSGNLRVYANVYEKNGKVLGALETEEEWNTVESIYAKLSEKVGD